MSDWKEKLRPASFRGADFKIETHDSDIGGRRVKTHEYPGRDDHFTEDLGAKVKIYNVEAYVIGRDYMTARDRLIDACNKPGAGSLVHPYLGSFKAFCTGCRLKEGSNEGGMARFTLTFEDAGKNVYPAASINSETLLDQKADLAHVAIIDQFVKDFSVKGVPGFVADEAGSILTQMASQIDVNKTVIGSTGLTKTISTFAGSVASLVQDPSTLASTTSKLIVSMVPDQTGQSSDLDALEKMVSFGASLAPVPTVTATRKRQAFNQSALVSLVARAAVTEMARIAPKMSFDNQRDAFAMRDRIGDLLDVEMDVASENSQDQLFRHLSDLRVVAVKALSEKAPTLARVVNVVGQITEPALVTAHRLYQDASRENDIIRRNKLRHPGFVPGGETIEVLSEVANA